MSFWEKLIEYIKHPNKYFLIAFYVLFLGLLSAMICSFFFEFPEFLCYVLYAFSAIGLAYCVYTIIYLVPIVKAAFLKWAEKKQLTNSFVHDYQFRTVVFSLFSFLLDLGYAAFELVFSIMLRSAWLIVLACYYAILAFLRGGVLYQRRKDRRIITEGGDTHLKDLRVYRNCGITLIVLSLTMIGSIAQMESRVVQLNNAEIYVIALAAYTFWKMAFAIYNLVKARKQADLFVRALRNINLITAFVSMYVLMTAMFKVYSASDVMLSNIMTPIGAAVVLIVTATSGLIMTVYAVKLLKTDGASKG